MIRKYARGVAKLSARPTFSSGREAIQTEGIKNSKRKVLIVID
jgi:hypothetical protein